MKPTPPKFRIGHSGDLACPHRDVSCCESCADEHEEIIEVYGQHFWEPDLLEREALNRMMHEEEDCRNA